MLNAECDQGSVADNATHVGAQSTPINSHGKTDAKPPLCPTALAISRNDVEQVFRLVTVDNVNNPYQDEYGWTPLLWACDRGSSEIVSGLLHLGADPRVRDTLGWTCAHLAARLDRCDVMKMLLETADFDIDVNSLSVQMWTPLMWSATEGLADMTRMLLDNGADPMARDSNGFISAHQASQNNHLDVLMQIGNHTNSALHAVTGEGWTCLMIAAKNMHLDVFAYLLEQNCSADPVSVHRVSVVHVLASRSDEDVAIAMLSMLGDACSCDEADDEGMTPLMYSCRGSMSKLVAIMVESHSADLFVRNNRGQTALDCISDDDDDDRGMKEYVLSKMMSAMMTREAHDPITM